MKDTLKNIFAKGGPFIGLILVIGLFALPTETREYFLTYNNFKIILTQTVIVAIGALGMTMIIVIPSAPMATITVCVRMILKLL